MIVPSIAARTTDVLPTLPSCRAGSTNRLSTSIEGSNPCALLYFCSQLTYGFL